MSERSNVLILPGDSAPSSREMKKALLFFDSVTLANPKDQALVNEMEVEEVFPNGVHVAWSERNRFPRVPEYLDEFYELVGQTNSLQNRGLVRMTPNTPLPHLDSGLHYCVWHSAITDEGLVKAAAPDRYDHSIPPLPLEATYMRGMIISVDSFKSKYEIQETRPPVEFSDVDEYWSRIAHQRLGRALKFLRISHAMGLSPLAFDRPNQEILSSSGNFADLIAAEGNSLPVGRTDFNLEVFETDELLDALDAMSWQEVVKLRKYILPGMNELRAYLNKSIKLKQKLTSVNRESYTNEVSKLIKDFEDDKEKLAAAWEKLRIASITRFGGAVGAGALADASGLIAHMTGVPWADLLIKIFASGLVATSTLTSELQTLIPARRAIKQSPVYFIDKLPRRGS